MVMELARNRHDLFRAFERVWGELLDAEPQHVLDVAITSLAMDDALFGISPGKITRSNRHQQVMASLEDIGHSRGDIEDAGIELDPKLSRMLRSITYGQFEDLFVAAWIVPEARQRGATLRDKFVGVRLAEFIKTFSDATKDDAHGQTEH
jgi:hypothetical protein